MLLALTRRVNELALCVLTVATWCAELKQALIASAAFALPVFLIAKLEMLSQALAGALRTQVRSCYCFALLVAASAGCATALRCWLLHPLSVLLVVTRSVEWVALSSCASICA